MTFGAPGSDLALEGDRLTWREEPLMATGELGARRPQPRERHGRSRRCARVGAPAESVRDGLSAFAGLAHRLEEVATVAGVLYVNDSKATNVAAAVRGIEAFEGGVRDPGRQLQGRRLSRAAGGRAIALSLVLPDRAGQRRAEADLVGAAPLRRCGDLATAVRRCGSARPGEVVLLSPACASYDQYRDYEERGGPLSPLRARVPRVRIRRSASKQVVGMPAPAAASDRSSTPSCTRRRSACSPAEP